MILGHALVALVALAIFVGTLYLNRADQLEPRD